MFTKKGNSFNFLSLILLFAIVTIFSCESNDKYVPDISGIKVDLKVRRFEQDLFAIDTNNYRVGLTNLEKNYPQFFPIFIGNILRLNMKDSVEAYQANLGNFLKHPPLKMLYDSCQIKYTNQFEPIKAELTEAFRYYKHYFPKDQVPEIITFLSEYSLAAGVGQNQVYIGLDMFLGSEHPFYYYPPVSLPRYFTETMTHEYLVARAIEAVAEDKAGFSKGSTLLDQMIHHGKILYLLDCFLPYTADHIKFGYSEEKAKWCIDNEFQMWQDVFVDRLYESSMLSFRSFIAPGPTTPGMPPESPGRTGRWVGYQIIKKYMKQFPETKLESLIQQEDAQKILAGSRYKPN